MPAVVTTLPLHPRVNATRSSYEPTGLPRRNLCETASAVRSIISQLTQVHAPDVSRTRTPRMTPQDLKKDGSARAPAPMMQLARLSAASFTVLLFSSSPDATPWILLLPGVETPSGGLPRTPRLCDFRRPMSAVAVGEVSRLPHPSPSPVASHAADADSSSPGMSPHDPVFCRRIAPRTPPRATEGALRGHTRFGYYKYRVWRLLRDLAKIPAASWTT